MKAYSRVSRKTVGEKRIAICPEFGCETITKVKPLKFGFLGFGKYPKCKKHDTPLVYVDERIGDFVDAALACLFDRAGLPPEELLKLIKKKFPGELDIFIRGWIYCITIGRGAPIISRYMDTLTKAYLKKLTKKQLKSLKDVVHTNISSVHKVIKKGMQEITKQYTRLLKHLRVHSEIIIEANKVKSLSNSLKNVLHAWQNLSLKEEAELLALDEMGEIPLSETKSYYDHILNIGTCRCLLGLSPEGMNAKKKRVNAFDRFSAYFDFFTEGLTKKFKKSDIDELLRGTHSKPSEDQMTIREDICPNEVDLRVSKSFIEKNKKLEIHNFEPLILINLIRELGNNNIYFLEIKDQNYLQKRNKYSFSPIYSDGDIEFWIKTYKLKHYGGSWKSVFDFIVECNKIFNLDLAITPFYNGMIPLVKAYCHQHKISYEKLMLDYGIHKNKKPPKDEEVINWIQIYQNQDIGGSIPAVRRYLDNYQGYTLGETTIRRHIKKFFLNGKYKYYFDEDLTYEDWLEIYNLKYFRKNIPLDPKVQSHEYILIYNIKSNQYKRIFIKDLADSKFPNYIENLRIFGIANDLRPNKVNINQIRIDNHQKSLEIVCKHGSAILSPDQCLFTIDNDCNIIEIKASELKVGTPLLMPRLLEVYSNDKPIDLVKFGKLIIRNNTQYIGQHGKIAYRYIEKGPYLGTIIGQYEAEGTFPSKYQSGTIISVSVNKLYIQKLQKIIKKALGLEFRIIKRRVEKCKKCGSQTVKNGVYNTCPKCKDTIYQEYYELATKTKLAKTIFTKGLELEHAYSYLKELPPFLYNAPLKCQKEFILSYFKGDGSKRDYRDKGGTFDINFETSSRRLVFGLNFLMKKLGVIMSINEHKPPSDRLNSKLMYSMIIRGSSNYEILKSYFNFLPEIDYTTSDIKPSINTQILLRKLNIELQNKYNISLRDLSNREIIPKNATYVSTQLKRKTNLSEILLLRTLDGLKRLNLLTPLANRMERIFRYNTFTKVKKIIQSNKLSKYYKISIKGLGYCCGTSFIYVKSDPDM